MSNSFQISQPTAYSVGAVAATASVAGMARLSSVNFPRPVAASIGAVAVSVLPIRARIR